MMEMPADAEVLEQAAQVLDAVKAARAGDALAAEACYIFIEESIKASVDILGDSAAKEALHRVINNRVEKEQEDGHTQG